MSDGDISAPMLVWNLFQKLPFVLKAEKTILKNASAFAIKNREKGELHPRNTKAATLPEIEKEKEVAPRSTLLSLFTLFILLELADELLSKKWSG